MASGRPERAYHQDYVARIRYSNALPPPPCPPKLLDIPGIGLSSGHYTNASYGSRLAREQPLNIEADAELGMPIDLIGLPGVFDGNEAAIMARDPPIPLHPHDRALMKPLSQLGKGGSANVGITFLRKTEYISSDQGVKRFESSTSKDLLRMRNNNARKRKSNIDKEDSGNILNNVIKGFVIAHPEDSRSEQYALEKIAAAQITPAEQSAWSAPKHPTKPDLELLDSYPLLPDLEAVPAVGSYILIKYNTDPSASVNGYNQCLDVAILKPTNSNHEKFNERMEAYEKDLSLTKPTTEYDYELYMMDDMDAVKNVKRKFDSIDNDRDASNLYNHTDDEGKRFFKFNRVRAYETFQQQGEGGQPYDDSVTIAIHDPALDKSGKPSRLNKGAYIYPVLQRTQLRPKRKQQHHFNTDNNQISDVLLMSVRDADEEEMARKIAARATLDTTIVLPESNEDTGPAEIAAEA